MHKFIIFLICCLSNILFATEDSSNTDELASNTTLSDSNKKQQLAATSIKDIYQILTCNDCCYPINKDTCRAFYSSCNDPILYDHKFFYTDKNLTDSDVVAKIKNHLKINCKNHATVRDSIILFVKNETVYFSNKKFEKFKNRITKNIIKVATRFSQDDPNNEEEDPYITETINTVSDALSNVTVRNRVKKCIYLTELSFKNFQSVIILIYENYFNKIDKYKIIPIKNPNLLKNCKKKTAKFTTLMPITNSNNNLNISFIHATTNSKLNKSSSLSTVIIVSCALGAVIIIVVIVVFIVHRYHKNQRLKQHNIKQHNKRKNLPLPNKPNIINNTEIKYASSDNIYEEPYFPNDPENIEHPSQYEKNIQYFTDDSSQLTDNNKNAINDNEQNSASSDIIISSAKTGNKPVTVIVVEPNNYKIITTNTGSAGGGKTQKAILIDLPENTENTENQELENLDANNQDVYENQELADKNTENNTNPINNIYHILENTNNKQAPPKPQRLSRVYVDVLAPIEENE